MMVACSGCYGDHYATDGKGLVVEHQPTIRDGRRISNLEMLTMRGAFGAKLVCSGSGLPPGR